MPVYKQFDQAALNLQYNLRAQVPDFAIYLERADLYSRQTEKELYSIKNLPYGSLPLEKLDVYPSANPFSKTHVFIHGGYWQRFGKGDFQFMAKAFQGKDITTVLIDYPLAPGASMDQMVNSCRLALEWLHDNVSKYNGDPNQIYLSGHSAGAHLAAMTLSENSEKMNRITAWVKGACLISGIFNLLPIHLSDINQVLQLNHETVERNSPVQLLPACECPVSIIVGAEETTEFLDQSRELFFCWKKKVPVEILEFEGLNHYSILETILNPDSKLQQAIFRLMDIG